MFEHWKRRRVLSAALIAGLALTAGTAMACGGDDDDDDATPTTASGATTAPTTGGGATTAPTTGGGDEFDYGDLSGALNIDGSSTVYPITELAAIDFNGVAPDVDITVGFVGTGGGGEKFCRGEIDLWDASRPAKESDIEDGCDPAGVASMDDLIEFQVGIDALSVVVNPANDWAQCMTVEQLNMAFKDGGATKWSDLDPSWPAEDIVFYYPGTDSGTYDYFVEVIIDEFEGSNHRSDGTSSEDDNVLALGVEEDEYAIGYFGFAYFQEAGDTLGAVSVDGGDGCVEPSFDNALAGDYQPLSRPLFIYSSEEILSAAPQAVGFVKFILENTEIVADAGYITMPDDLVAEQQAKLEPFLD